MISKSAKTLAAAIMLLSMTGSGFTAASAQESNDSGSKPSRVLEGGVKGTAIQFEEGLNNIGTASDMIQNSTLKIMKEATRKETIVMRGPNVLPGGVVVPGLGGDNGVMQFGELPIRRDKLNAFLADTEQAIGALQTYIDALILPTDLTADASQAYTDLKTTMQETQEHLQKLKDLAGQKKLANTKIGREALKIHDSMDAMQKWKAILMQAAVAANPVQKE